MRWVRVTTSGLLTCRFVWAELGAVGHLDHAVAAGDVGGHHEGCAHPYVCGGGEACANILSGNISTFVLAMIMAYN